MVPPTTLRATSAHDARFDDWRWQAQHTVRDLAALERTISLTDAEREGTRRALSQGLPLAITPYYLSLIDADDPACPIRRQCVPVADEAVTVEGDLRDPLGEEAHEVAPGLVQRYPDRALLLVTDRCGVYCRFCTRSRMVGDGGGARSLTSLKPAFDYLRAHPEVREVIVSGGDPGLMSTSRLEAILTALGELPHLDTLRFATRTPVTLPQRITDDLCAALRRAHPAIWVMTHFNHPKELTPASLAACAKLVDAGLPVMNQTVLLRGVNDDEASLERLFRGLIRGRVRPYYLLQMDPVRGTSHLRTPLRRGVELMSALEGRISGIALPKLIVDTPGGLGKVPLGRDPVVSSDAASTHLRTFRGDLVEYRDPPSSDPDASA